MVDFFFFLFFFSTKQRASLGSPVVKTLDFSAGGVDLIPGQGTKIPHAMWHAKKRENKAER